MKKSTNSLSIVLALLAVLGVTPSQAQAADPSGGYQWRLVRSDMGAALAEINRNGGNRFESTYHADRNEISGTFRFLRGAAVEFDDVWRGRFASPPAVISASQPLDMRIEGSLSRRKPNAWHFYVNGLVEDPASSRNGGMAHTAIDLFNSQRAKTADLEFTPNDRTPQRFRVWMYYGSQGPKKSKAWVWWDYQREGTSGPGWTPPTDPGPTDPGPTDPAPADPATDVVPPPADPQPTTPGGRIIKADEYIVDQGDLIWVPIHLLRPAGVANMNYEVSYDASVVQVDGDLDAGNLIRSRGIFSGNPRRSGLIRLGFAADVGFERDGTVAEIPFRALGRPGTRTALDIEVSMVQDASGNTLPIERIDGSIEIRDHVGPGEDGPSGECDGRVGLTVADAQCALDMSVGLRTVNLMVDIDSDGQVTSADARQILQLAIRGGRQ